MGRLGLFRCQTASTCDEYARTAWSRKKGHVRQKLDPSGAAARKLTLAPPPRERVSICVSGDKEPVIRETCSSPVKLTGVTLLFHHV